MIEQLLTIEWDWIRTLREQIIKSEVWFICRICAMIFTIIASYRRHNSMFLAFDLAFWFGSRFGTDTSNSQQLKFLGFLLKL